MLPYIKKKKPNQFIYENLRFSPNFQVPNSACQILFLKTVFGFHCHTAILQSSCSPASQPSTFFTLSFYKSGHFSMVPSLLSRFLSHVLWFLLQHVLRVGREKKKSSVQLFQSLPPPFPRWYSHLPLFTEETFKSSFFFFFSEHHQMVAYSQEDSVEILWDTLQ